MHAHDKNMVLVPQRRMALPKPHSESRLPRLTKVKQVLDRAVVVAKDVQVD
jgi:hypothetical protein